MSWRISGAERAASEGDPHAPAARSWLIDSPGESVSLRGVSTEVVTPLSRLLPCLVARALATGLGALVLALCVSAIPPTRAAASSCAPADPGPQFCSQSSPSDPLPAMAPDTPAVEGAARPAAWVPSSPRSPLEAWFSLGPSAPRAPPVSRT